jgi:hypothetical protein
VKSELTTNHMPELSNAYPTAAPDLCLLFSLRDIDWSTALTIA